MESKHEQAVDELREVKERVRVLLRENKKLLDKNYKLGKEQ